MKPAKYFDLPAGRHYFQSHSIGLPVKGRRVELERTFLRPWEAGDGKAWVHWMAAISRFKSALADLLGGEPEDFCPQTNLSDGLAKILSSLPPAGARRRILCTERDFPGMGHALTQARSSGYEVTFIPEALDIQDASVWADHLGEDIALAFVTHCTSNTSQVLPVQDICRLARPKGILTVVDVAQSAGGIPINLGSWDADFVIGSCVKFLCGGPGAGWLWANPNGISRMEPAIKGWFSHENPFEFDIHNFEYAEDARRFWGGTPNVVPYVFAAHSIETLTGIGIDNIHAHNQALIDQVINALGEERFASCTSPCKRGNAFVVASGNPEADSARLHELGIIHDVRKTGLRFSVHVYNSEKDVKALLKALS